MLPGEPAAEADLRPGDTVVAVDDAAVSTFAELNDLVSNAAGRALRISVERRAQAIHGVELLTKYVTPRKRVRVDVLGRRQVVGRIGVAPLHRLPQVGVIDGSPAAHAGLRSFDLVVAVQGHAVSTLEDLTPLTQPRSGTMVVVTYLRASPSHFGFASLSTLHAETAQIVPVLTTDSKAGRHYDTGLRRSDLFVAEVEANSEAERLGLKPGDFLLELDGSPVRAWALFEQALEERPFDEHRLRWQSGGAIHDAPFHVELRRHVDEYQSELFAYSIGAAPSRALRPVRPEKSSVRLGAALFSGIGRAAELAWMMVDVLARSLTGQLPGHVIGGPLLLYQVAGIAAERGFDQFLAMAALVSLNLGLLNLLPVPLLDGGQAVIAITEAVRRRPISARTLERATVVGMALLALLMLLAVRNDLVRHFSRG